MEVIIQFFDKPAANPYKILPFAIDVHIFLSTTHL
jgi:hypothetical protein